MERSAYTGPEVRVYPEVMMFSAATGDRALVAEPGAEYDFYDGRIPTDGFWDPPPAPPEDAPAAEPPVPDGGAPADGVPLVTIPTGG